jgi:hypothetical protein
MLAALLIGIGFLVIKKTAKVPDGCLKDARPIFKNGEAVWNNLEGCAVSAPAIPASIFR